jgi:hypothetical protein
VRYFFAAELREPRELEEERELEARELEEPRELDAGFDAARDVLRAGAFAPAVRFDAVEREGRAGVTAAASFSRSASSALFVFVASRRIALSARSISRYARLAPVPASAPSAWSALLASSSAFSKRAMAFSTSLRVTVLADEAPARARLAGFFAGGMSRTPCCVTVDVRAVLIHITTAHALRNTQRDIQRTPDPRADGRDALGALTSAAALGAIDVDGRPWRSTQSR